MYKVSEHLLNMLYPRCCPICHKILKNQNRMVCPHCEKSLQPVTGARCMKCGKQVEGEQEYCKDCASHRREFTEGRGIFLYDSKWKASLMKFKYYGCREYGDFYARCLYIYGKKELLRWKPDLIVPVPIHWRKKHMRGFNQAEYLALRVGEASGIPVNCSLVRKKRKTKSQKKLDASSRRENLLGAFQIEENVKGLKILVIDDVYTTGSTMDAMAKCLKEKGAQQVFFLTVCIGSSQ